MNSVQYFDLCQSSVGGRVFRSLRFRMFTGKKEADVLAKQKKCKVCYKSFLLKYKVLFDDEGINSERLFLDDQKRRKHTRIG